MYIDQTLSKITTLKSKMTSINVKYWEPSNDDIPILLNGVKRLILDGFMSTTERCKKARDFIKLFWMKVGIELQRWQRADTDEKRDEAYENVNSSFFKFGSHVGKIMEGCRSSMYETMIIGCNDFLSVYANIDIIAGSIPSTIQVEGQTVHVKTLRSDGFTALYNKMFQTLVDSGSPIGAYSIPLIENAAFIMVVCQETPFVLKAFKVIETAPQKGSVWNVSGGLENITKEKGLGTRLMRATEALGNAYEIEKMKIMAVKEAEVFYEKYGMAKLASPEDPYALYMSKRIGVLRGRKYFTLDDIKKGADDALRLR